MNINSYFLKKTIIKWYDSNKRDLPWRKKVNKKNDLAYRILISEIMLQQTTVNTVKNKYIKFIKKWPSLQSLALSPKNQLLTFWSGLGYYKRAINLHKSVRIIEKNLFIDLNVGYHLSYIVGEKEIGVDNFDKVTEFIKSKIEK